MTDVPEITNVGQPGERVSPASLDRLWPNRVHESNWLKTLACWLGLHRWYEMSLEGYMPAGRQAGSVLLLVF
jgi:hypothetical protein